MKFDCHSPALRLAKPTL